MESRLSAKRRKWFFQDIAGIIGAVVIVAIFAIFIISQVIISGFSTRSKITKVNVYNQSSELMATYQGTDVYVYSHKYDGQYGGVEIRTHGKTYMYYNCQVEVIKDYKEGE